MSAPPISIPALTQAASHLTASKYYALAAYVMFVYDIFLTFPLEIEKIWTKKFNGLTILWFSNRWFFLAGVTITYVAYLDPNWSGAACDAFFRYPGYVLTIQRLTVGSIFLLRIYCIYNRDLRPAAIVAVFVIAEATVKLVSLQLWAAPVQLPPGLTSCILAVTPQNASKFIGYWLTELCTDGAIFFATIYRSYDIYWKNGRGSLSSTYLWRVIVKDGILYFAIMLTSNLVTVIQYLTLPQDLKAINANFGAVCTSLLTARLVLNLKIAGTHSPSNSHLHSGFVGPQNTWEAAVCGPLGNELEGVSLEEKRSRPSEEYELGKMRLPK